MQPPELFIVGAGRRLQACLACEPRCGPFAQRDPAERRIHPLPSVDVALLLCRPMLSVHTSDEVPAVLPAVRGAITGTPAAVRSFRNADHGAYRPSADAPMSGPRPRGSAGTSQPCKPAGPHLVAPIDRPWRGARGGTPQFRPRSKGGYGLLHDQGGASTIPALAVPFPKRGGASPSLHCTSSFLAARLTARA